MRDFDMPLNDDELIAENQKLERELVQRGGTVPELSEIPPFVYHQLLKVVLEEAQDSKILLRELFPKDYTFPSPQSMNSSQLEEKLKSMYTILQKNYVVVELADKILPIMAYEYLLRQIFTIRIPKISGVTIKLTGCDWDCPQCFQLDYCDLQEESH